MLLSLLRAARLLCEDSTPLLSRVSQVSINPCQVQNQLTRLPNKPFVTMGLLELIHAIAQPETSSPAKFKTSLLAYPTSPSLQRDFLSRYMQLHILERCVLVHCPYTGAVLYPWAVIPLLVRDAQQRQIDIHGV